MYAKLAKLTVEGRLPKARLALGRWLGLCQPIILDAEECSCFGPAHAHLTIAIPDSFAEEFRTALVKWANVDAGGAGALLFYDGELPWPDETDDD